MSRRLSLSLATLTAVEVGWRMVRPQIVLRLTGEKVERFWGIIPPSNEKEGS